MRPRPAEVHHQPIAQVLRHVAVIPRDDLAAGALIRLHQIAQFLRVEALGQRGGAHQIAEHDGELAALGVKSGRC